MNKTLF